MAVSLTSSRHGSATEKPLQHSHRELKPGTTGWTADDLDIPQIAAAWEQGRYEIVEGVLTTMPAAYLDGTFALGRLRRTVERHLDAMKQPGDFAGETDFIVGRK